ncbi:hypothetical protein GC176_14720 [bacterium]|nr:hypothetical protein [bacterium]
MIRSVLTLTAFLTALPIVAASDFKEPVQLMSSGQPIDVEHEGHAAPFVGDYDGDGRDDLLVGESFTGRLRIYRNVGTGVDHRFDGFTLFLDGDKDGCISPPRGTFRPQLVDFDGDGDTDIITGNRYGDVILFERSDSDRFLAGRTLTKPDGARLRLGDTTIPFAFDWDADGDLDLVVGSNEGLFLVRNEGSRSSFVPTEREPMEVDAVPQTTRNLSYCPTVADWDADGLPDLLCGTRDGSVICFRNTGTRESPNLTRADDLVPAATKDEERGGMARICVTDWNSNGRLDLVLGDSGAEFEKQLTDEELAEREAALMKQSDLLTEWTLLFRKYREAAANRVSGPDRSALWNARMRDVRTTMQHINHSREVARRQVESITAGKQTHGRVWLFLRKP